VTAAPPATPSAPGTAEHQLARAVEQLVGQLAQWPPARWRAARGSGAGTPADRVHALVQQLADLCAGVEGRPGRPVPRLAADLALPDQLTVVTVDLLAAGPAAPVLAAALDAVRGMRTTL